MYFEIVTGKYFSRVIIPIPVLKIDMDSSGIFSRELTDCQSRLYAYISTLLGNAEGVHDVLQETNVTLWQKASDYDPTRPFLAWAYGFAYMQVLAYRKKQSRGRLIFDETLLNQVSRDYHQHDADMDAELVALDSCLKRLPKHSRELVRSRYDNNRPIQDIARERGEAANTVSATLCRVRKALMECIKSSLAGATP